MTRVVIVGEIYNTDLSIGGGPIYPGAPSHPWVPPSPGSPAHPIQPVPPGFWGGVAPPYPSQGPISPPPGYWGGVAPPYPDQGLPPGSPGVPTHPITLPEPLPPPPPEIAHNVVVAVWNPTNEEWSVRVGEAHPTPHA